MKITYPLYLLIKELNFCSFEVSEDCMTIFEFNKNTKSFVFLKNDLGLAEGYYSIKYLKKGLKLFFELASNPYDSVFTADEYFVDSKVLSGVKNKKESDFGLRAWEGTSVSDMEIQNNIKKRTLLNDFYNENKKFKRITVFKSQFSEEETLSIENTNENQFINFPPTYFAFKGIAEEFDIKSVRNILNKVGNKSLNNHYNKFKHLTITIKVVDGNVFAHVHTGTIVLNKQIGVTCNKKNFQFFLSKNQLPKQNDLNVYLDTQYSIIRFWNKNIEHVTQMQQLTITS